MDDLSAPGWDAITEAFARIYPGQEPRHVGCVPGLAFGSGLQGCSAFRAADHWHYVTYGLTELWRKDPDAELSISGWGYELTMRVVAHFENESPAWPFDLLEKVARYTQENAHPFQVGDRLDPGGPITGQDDTRLVAVAFANDPELPATDSLNGRFEFRQLVGVPREELDEMKATNTADVLARFQITNPLLITDPSR